MDMSLKATKESKTHPLVARWHPSLFEHPPHRPLVGSPWGGALEVPQCLALAVLAEELVFNLDHAA